MIEEARETVSADEVPTVDRKGKCRRVRTSVLLIAVFFAAAGVALIGFLAYTVYSMAFGFPKHREMATAVSPCGQYRCTVNEVNLGLVIGCQAVLFRRDGDKWQEIDRAEPFGDSDDIWNYVSYCCINWRLVEGKTVGVDVYSDLGVGSIRKLPGRLLASLDIDARWRTIAINVTQPEEARRTK